MSDGIPDDPKRPLSCEFDLCNELTAGPISARDRAVKQCLDLAFAKPYNENFVERTVMATAMKGFHSFS